MNRRRALALLADFPLGYLACLVTDSPLAKVPPVSGSTPRTPSGTRRDP